LTLDGGRTLQNDGTFNWASGQIDMGYNPFGTTIGGSAIVNSLGATFNDTTAGTIANYNGTNAFNNAGTFTTSFASGTTTIGVTFNNTGTVDAQSGTLDFNGAFSNTGTLIADEGNIDVAAKETGGGNATIFGNSQIEYDAASNDNITFASGATGELLLLASASFTGTVTGFTGSGTGTPATSDKLDLRDINFSSAKFAKSYAGNVLTVTDGTHTANISMVGTYTLASFHFASDGSGGTLVTDPPVASQSEGVVDPSLASSGENAALSGLSLPNPGPATEIGDFASVKSLRDRSNSPVRPLSDEKPLTSGANSVAVSDIAFRGIDLGQAPTVANWLPTYDSGGSMGEGASLHDRALALFGQSMASFATADEGHGDMSIADPPPDQQHHLSLPHA
jgi:hypothetical protein